MEPLADGVVGDEGREVIEYICVPARRQLGVDARLLGVEQQCLEAGGPLLREPVIDQAGERHPSSEGDGLGEAVDRVPRTAGRRRVPPVAHQPLDAQSVDRVRLDAQHVARPSPSDGVPTEEPPEL